MGELFRQLFNVLSTNITRSFLGSPFLAPGKIFYDFKHQTSGHKNLDLRWFWSRALQLDILCQWQNCLAPVAPQCYFKREVYSGLTARSRLKPQV